MLIFLIALVIGLIIGLFANVSVPAVYYSYITLTILVSMDSIIEAARAKYNRTYTNSFFFFQWISNVLLAGLFNAIGDALGVDLAVPVIIFLGMRMFSNIDKLRRSWFKRQNRRRRIIRLWVDRESNSTDLPVEKINPDNTRQSRSETLRNRARNLRIEADSLVSEADALEEDEAIEQLSNLKKDENNKK